MSETLKTNDRIVQWFDLFVIWLSASSHDREAGRRRQTRSKHECEIAGCKLGAVHFVRWGESVNQQGNFCHNHLQELWDRIHTQVANGVCWWEQSLPIGYTNKE